MEVLSYVFFVLALTSITNISKKNNIFTFLKLGFFGYLAAINKVLTIIYFTLALPIFLFFTNRKQKEHKVTNTLLIQHITTFLLLFCYLILVEKLVAWPITTSQLFFIFIFILFSTIIYYQNYSLERLLEIIFSVAFGIKIATSVSYFNSDPRNHNTLLVFYEHMKRYSAKSAMDAINFNAVHSYLLNFLSCCQSKFYISWIKYYPIQILVVVVFSIILRLMKSNKIRQSLFLFLLLTCYLLFEALSKMRIIIPDHLKFSLANYNSVSYYKVYTELFLILSFALSIQYFIQVTKFRRFTIILFYGSSMLISYFSFFKNLEYAVNDKFTYIPVKQTPQFGCTCLNGYSPDFIKHFKKISPDCESSVKIINSRY